jgi:hypothetical protein
MTIALTALQVILGLIFLFTGTIKLTTPKSQLPAKGVTGFENIPESLIKWLALAEILGAVTLLIFSIPKFPKFPLQLSVTAFSVLMIAACYHHWKRKENKNVIVTFILFFICLIILFLR